MAPTGQNEKDPNQFRGQNLILWTEFNFVNKMLFRVMKPILSTKLKQSSDKYFLLTELKCP